MKGRWIAVIFVGLALAGCAGSPPPEQFAAGSADEDIHIGLWSADRCEGFSVVWTPPLPVLSEAIGPRWTPDTGPLPGRGVFVLFVARCPSWSVDNVTEELGSVAAAIVPIQTPEDRLGHDVTEWSAVPETIGDPSSRALRLFADAGFSTTAGAPTLEVENSPSGAMISMQIATRNGTIEAEGFVGGQPQPDELEGALAGTETHVTGVFTGPESYTRYDVGSVVVRGNGDTWMSRLELEPVPFAVAYDTAFQWDFDFWRHETGAPPSPSVMASRDTG